MTQAEDFVISSPYVRTTADDALIQQASPTGNKASDWTKGCLQNFKTRVREYYMRVQNRRCAYCRTVIKTSQASAEIEHIVDKSGKPVWMYEPFNLCASCKMCNTKKNRKRVLKKGTFSSLSHNSLDYIFVHPHLDKYSEHINIIDGILYEGLTSKGKETIRICNLDRYELAADRAEERIKVDKSLDERMLLALVSHQGKPLVNVTAKFEERIHQIIQDYKNRD